MDIPLKRNKRLIQAHLEFKLPFSIHVYKITNELQSNDIIDN